MKIFNGNMGRRKFVSMSSMALGAGMLVKPSRMLFAADGAPQGQPPQGGGGPMGMGAQTPDDGTKYGKYIVLSQKSGPNERGSIPVVATLGNAIPDATPWPMVYQEYQEEYDLCQSHGRKDMVGRQ